MTVDGKAPAPHGPPSRADHVGASAHSPDTKWAPPMPNGNLALVPVSSSLAEKVQNGELRYEQYLDAKAELAVAHLAGQLPVEQKESIRVAIRDQLEHDPLLARLGQQATRR